MVYFSNAKNMYGKKEELRKGKERKEKEGKGKKRKGKEKKGKERKGRMSAQSRTHITSFVYKHPKIITISGVKCKANKQEIQKR